MTTAEAGSVAHAPAGNPSDATTGADTGSAAAAGDWFAGLSGDNRKLAETKGWKSGDDAFTSYRELEKLQGSSLKRPADDASETEWNSFYSKVGRPEKPEAYEFKRPQGLPSDLPYDEALAGNFKAWAHQAGLNGKQAQTLHDQFALAQAEQAKAHVTALTKAVESTADALVKEWGPQDSEGFKRNHELTNRALKKLGLVESFKKAGIIHHDGALTDPTLAMAFSVIGERMFAEDKDEGGDINPDGENPFKRETFNLSKITALGERDPDKARRLARQAGVNPDHWIKPKR